MDPGHDRRLRDVWGNTQDNLESAVGTAYTSLTGFHRAFVQPAYKSVVAKTKSTAQSTVVCCCGAAGLGKRNGNYHNSNRRDSFDIFYDLYEDEVYGRDELDRLLNSQFSDEEDDEEGSGQARRSTRNTHKGKGHHATAYAETAMAADDQFPGGTGGGPSHTHHYGMGMAVEPPIDFEQEGLIQTGPNKFKDWLVSLFTFNKHRRPNHSKSTAAATAGRMQERGRSNTRSSANSSDTFRSRAELFSEDADSAVLADAQMMGEDFAVGLEFKSTHSSTADDEDAGLQQGEGQGEGEGEGAEEGGPQVMSDGDLRQEEAELEREEEEAIERERERAARKAEELGLGGVATTEDTEQQEQDEQEEQEDEEGEAVEGEGQSEHETDRGDDGQA